VAIYATAEIVADTEEVVDTLVKINTRGLDATAEQVAQLTATVRKTASKRALLKFRPDRYVSWDHGKLGGRY
jgi:hypothetical protein